jgi:hypothetical protein
MFDSSGGRACEWRLGKKLSFTKDVDAVDITAVCADGDELEFLTSIIEGLTYPKNYGVVWWYAGTAKTVASILESYKDLQASSEEFLDRKKKIRGAKKKVVSAIDKIKEFNPLP